MRNAGLDILRFVALVLVLVRHLEPPPDGGGALLQTLIRGGWVGVDIFFVLSGFLVSGLLFREYRQHQRVDIKRFLIRRALKIYPSFYLMLFVTLVVMLLRGQPVEPAKLLGELLFLQNYLGALWPPTWSLAVEEHFYILIAVVFYRFVQSRPGHTDPFSRVPAMFLTLILVCLGFRLLNLVIWDEYTNRRFLFGTHLRMDSLMCGVFLSYLWHFHGLEGWVRRWPGWLLGVVGAAAFIPAFIYPMQEYPLLSVLGVMLFYVGGGFLVLAFVRIEKAPGVLLRGIAALGAASYSIYLWHMPVHRWGGLVMVKILGVESHAILAVAYLAGSFAWGYIMNKALEWPMLRLRDRLYPSR